MTYLNSVDFLREKEGSVVFKLSSLEGFVDNKVDKFQISIALFTCPHCKDEHRIWDEYNPIKSLIKMSYYNGRTRMDCPNCGQTYIKPKMP